MRDAVFELPGLVPSAVQQVATIVEHELMARNTWRMRLKCPQIAAQILPGQFFMIRTLVGTDPLIGRPFALYDIYVGRDGQAEGVDFGYVVVGKMTSLLASLRIGDAVEIWGPLGNGFPAPHNGHLILVAGGIGQTPFLAVIREAIRSRTYGKPARVVNQSPTQITICYGVRSAEYLAGVKEFQQTGVEVRIATDDGTAGHHGFATELLKPLLETANSSTRIYCCGPEPMMIAVGRIAAAANVDCWLSLETPMACGFGACFSCVAKVRQLDGSWDYRRVCVEGPVFPSAAIVFD